MATADSVKAKLQSLIAKANATTGKTDADLTSSVASLIAGYGQGGSGGGGQCTRPHVIEVEEIPTEDINKNAVYFCDGKYYKYNEDFQDVAVNTGYLGVMCYLELIKEQGAVVSTNVIPTKTTDGILASDPDNGVFHFYYIADETEANAFLYGEGVWISFGEMLGGATYGGVISDVSEATEPNTYYVLGNVGFKEYAHANGTLEITENGTYNVADKNKVVVNTPCAIFVQTVADLPTEAQVGSMAIVLEG